MKALIERMYKSIVGRGLITPTTSCREFIYKLDEELNEVKEEFYIFCNEDWDSFDKKDKYVEELTDLATVCFMQIKHLGYDPIKEFKKVLEKNEKRANESLRISRNKIEQ